MSDTPAERPNEALLNELMAELDAEEDEADPRLSLKIAKIRDRLVLRDVMAELRQLLTLERRQEQIIETVQRLSARLEIPPCEPLLPEGPEATPYTWCLVTSDWQMGQRNRPEENGFLWEQTSEICERQVREMWARVLKLQVDQAGRKQIDELVLFFLGDLIENDQMRPSQATEIDELVTEQTLRAARLAAWLIGSALRRFPRVRVEWVGGNHGRTSPRGGVAGLGELGARDTYEWLIGKMLEDRFAEAVEAGRLRFNVADSFWGAARICAQRVVYEHGASLRLNYSQGGPPATSVAVGAAQYQRMLDGADLILMGHTHWPMYLPLNGGYGSVIVNGALPPSSSYIQGKSKSIIRPTQTLFELHRSHGVTSYMPIYLEHEAMIRPGEFWATVEEDGPDAVRVLKEAA